MKRRILSMAVAVALVFCMAPVTAMADTTVSTEAELRAAIAAIADSTPTTITLNGSFSLTSPLSIPAGRCVILGSTTAQTINVSAANPVNVSGDLYITGNMVIQGTAATGSLTAGLVNVASGGYLTVDGGAQIINTYTYTTKTNSTAVYNNFGSIDVSSGKVAETATGGTGGTYSCGINSQGGQIVLSGGEVAGWLTGIRGDGTLIILVNGTVSGCGYGINAANHSTLIMAGGAVKMTGIQFDEGSFDPGAAIDVAGTGNLEIRGGTVETVGTISGTWAHQYEYICVKTEGNATAKISGGTLTANAPAGWGAYGIDVAPYSSLTMSGGTVTASAGTGRTGTGIVTWGRPVDITGGTISVTGGGQSLCGYPNSTMRVTANASLSLTGPVRELPWGAPNITADFLTGMPSPVSIKTGETKTISIPGAQNDFSVDASTTSTLGAALGSDKHSATITPTAAGTAKLVLYSAGHDGQTLTLTIPVTVTASATPTPTPAATPTPTPVSGGGSSSISPASLGLPNSITLHTGGRAMLTPSQEGGTWHWDPQYISAHHSTFTVTALKAGTTELRYSMGWGDVIIPVTILPGGMPQTGQDYTIMFVLIALAAAAVSTAVVLMRLRKKTK